MGTDQNDFERSARRQKVNALCLAVDQIIEQVADDDPIFYEMALTALIARLDGADGVKHQAEAWGALTCQGQLKHAPSDTTKAHTLKALREWSVLHRCPSGAFDRLGGTDDGPVNLRVVR